MRRLSHDPTGEAAIRGRDAVFRAAYKSATNGDITDSKTMKISAGKGLPAPTTTHIHHQRSSPKPRRAVKRPS